MKRIVLPVVMLTLACWPWSCSILQPTGGLKQPALLVNPFIGTGGHGHTYPGATVPFGMVQLSPDTRLEGWDGCGGYHYDDSLVYGFSHTHLQGTGVSDYGDILFMPTNGRLRQADSWNDAYKSRFSHKRENARPGYYSVTLDDYNMKVELTATARTGIHRYSSAKSDSCRLFVDMMHRDELLQYDLQTVGDTVLYGYRISRAWAQEQHCYFYAVFSRPFSQFTQLDVSYDETDASGQKKNVLEQVQVFSLQFAPGTEIMVKVGLSGTSVEGAKKNLYAEAPHWNFDRYSSDALAMWNEQLSKQPPPATLKGDELVNYYTALYHCCTTPNVWSDVDGWFRGMDNKMHRADGYVRYTVFSLWDTFRALHPLLAGMEPERTLHFVRTMLDMYRETGYLPEWELAGNETHCMIGYHACSVIADAWARGIRNFDANLALEAMMASANGPGRDKRDYALYGYVPGDRHGESVSKTLEYAYDDWCIAQFAKAIGRREEYEEYIQRAQNWKNVFDPQTGFMRARRNGGFAEPFDPFEVNFHYTEANAFQYQFFVPHDAGTLMQFMGGADAFIQKLDYLFSAKPITTGREQPDISGLIGQYAHGNEPSHHMAFLYQYCGQMEKARAKAAQILRTQYHNAPDGLCGNEDCGQMSAWYVMAAQGRYPQCPGGYGEFRFNTWNMKNFVEDRTIPETPVIAEHLIAPVPIIRGPQYTFFSQAEVSIDNALTDATIKVEIIEDGRSPKKFLYTKPFSIQQTCTINAWAEKPGHQRSKTAIARYTLRSDARTMKSISAYDPQYAAGGNEALIDGIEGGEDFRAGFWQGFWKKDLEAVVDLGGKQIINHLGLRCYQEIKPWIWFPSEVLFYTSRDGIHFTPAGAVTNKTPLNDERVLIEEFGLEIDAQEVRYVKVIAKPAFDSIPSWHPGSGGKPWIFADEIIIR